MKSLAVTIFISTLLIASAQAQQGLPPVDSMNCAQMTAEMMSAGQQVQSQLDPNYLSDMQKGNADVRRQVAAGMAAVPGMTASSVACGYGALPACAVNAAQGAAMEARAKANAPRNEALAERGVTGAVAATRGLDVARMQALGARFESQRCPMPGGR